MGDGGDAIVRSPDLFITCCCGKGSSEAVDSGTMIRAFISSSTRMKEEGEPSHSCFLTQGFLSTMSERHFLMAILVSSGLGPEYAMNRNSPTPGSTSMVLSSRRLSSFRLRSCCLDTEIMFWTKATRLAAGGDEGRRLPFGEIRWTGLPSL